MGKVSPDRLAEDYLNEKYNMATKLHGSINLSRIPKELIQQNLKGDKVIWVDIMETLNGPDQYGNTHTVILYNKNGEQGKKNIYLGNFRPVEFGNAQQNQAPAAAPAQAPAPQPIDSIGGDIDDDLPF